MQSSLFNDAPSLSVAAQAAPTLRGDALSQDAVAQLSPDWQPLVAQFASSSAGSALRQHLAARQAAGARVYPPQPLRALQVTALQSVKVVILGQDPYHGPAQAEGLAFSVANGVKVPPSLRNIFKERERDLGLPVPTSAQASCPANGSLAAWAAQGVLLLNTTLTVEDGQPASHAKQGWEVLTDAVIQACAQKSTPVVFMLWGGHAQSKQALIAAHNLNQRHTVLCANHPSPLSALRPPAPFMGCGHFGLARLAVARVDAPAAKTLFIL